MSIINDALKKAEQESKKRKETETAPVLNPPSREMGMRMPPVAATPLRPREKARFILFFLAFVFLIAAAVTVKNFFFHGRGPVTAPAQTEDAGDEAGAPSPLSLPSADALPKLVLNGIVYDEEKPYAIVNNKVLMKGDELYGAVLVGINKESVKFSYKDKEFELEAN